jgi:hypothetical protein
MSPENKGPVEESQSQLSFQNDDSPLYSEAPFERSRDESNPSEEQK